ncbi:MAG: hypothetical protein IH596_12915 [Bacteroidales bacterium]|nr:hypothetical protein [Bacteroidales bacterium]
MATKIFWEEHGILFKHSETITDEEVMRMNDIMYGDVRFESIVYQIADYTDVTSNLITEKDAKVISTLDKVSAQWSSQRMRLAVVTRDEKFIPVVEGYFKEFEGTFWEGMIFENLSDAYAWVKQIT